MKIYSAQNSILYQPKFAQNKIVQSTIEIAKKYKDTIPVIIQKESK